MHINPGPVNNYSIVSIEFNLLLVVFIDLIIIALIEIYNLKI